MTGSMLAVTVADNARLVELLMEVRESAAWDGLPAWLRWAVEAEIDEAGGWRQSAIDQAERRGRLGGRQLDFLLLRAELRRRRRWARKETADD